MIRPITARNSLPAFVQSINFFKSSVSESKQSEGLVTTAIDQTAIAETRILNDQDKFTLSEPLLPSWQIAPDQRWNQRQLLRFGSVPNDTSEASLNPPQLNATPIASKWLPSWFSTSTQQIANEIFGYLKKNDTDILGTYHMIQDAKSFAQNSDLSSVFQSSAMTEIFSIKSSYNTLDDFFTAVEQRKDRLLAQLSLGKKFKYGLRIQSLLDSFEAKKPFLNGLSQIYAKYLGIKVGAAGADLMAYLFRPDMIDAKSFDIFDRFFKLLESDVKKHP